MLITRVAFAEASLVSRRCHAVDNMLPIPAGPKRSGRQPPTQSHRGADTRCGGVSAAQPSADAGRAGQAGWISMKQHLLVLEVTIGSHTDAAAHHTTPVYLPLASTTTLLS